MFRNEIAFRGAVPASKGVEYATTKLQTLVEVRVLKLGICMRRSNMPMPSWRPWHKKKATFRRSVRGICRGPLKERLKVLHGELHERIQREETSRVRGPSIKMYISSIYHHLLCLALLGTSWHRGGGDVAGRGFRELFPEGSGAASAGHGGGGPRP